MKMKSGCREFWGIHQVAGEPVDVGGVRAGEQDAISSMVGAGPRQCQPVGDDESGAPTGASMASSASWSRRQGQAHRGAGRRAATSNATIEAERDMEREKVEMGLFITGQPDRAHAPGGGERGPRPWSCWSRTTCASPHRGRPAGRGQPSLPAGRRLASPRHRRSPSKRGTGASCHDHDHRLQTKGQAARQAAASWRARPPRSRTAPSSPSPRRCSPAQDDILAANAEDVARRREPASPTAHARPPHAHPRAPRRHRQATCATSPPCPTPSAR